MLGPRSSTALLETQALYVAAASDETFLALDERHADHIHAGNMRLMLSAATTVNATSGAVLNR